jgi:stress response protein YsnF
MSKTVIGLMDNIGEAQDVVRDLVASGINRDDIGFMANQKHAVPESAHLNEGEGSRAASGALTGAGTGAALGGIAGLALAFAPLAIPGIGPILAAGPIAAALTGAGIGAVAGGLIGGLTNLGVPEEEAHYYAEGVRRGGILVTVAAESDAQAQTAVSVMRRHGAVDIDQRATEWKKQGWKGRFDADATSTAERTVPVTQEELVVGKRNVAAGGVRVYNRVIEQPVSKTVELQEEHVEVERRPVIRESAEEPVVEKRARVVEEVKVGKKRSKKTEAVQDTLRRTEVEVQRTGAANQLRYKGPERRVSRAPYQGVDRRKAA